MFKLHQVKKEEFTKEGLIKSVKSFYRNIYDLDEDPNVSLISIGNTAFTDIVVTFKDGSKKFRKDLTWTFSRTVKYIHD